MSLCHSVNIPVQIKNPPLKILAKYFYQLLFFKVAIFKGYSKLKYKALQLYTLNYDFYVIILKVYFSVMNSSYYFEG